MLCEYKKRMRIEKKKFETWGGFLRVPERNNDPEVKCKKNPATGFLLPEGKY